MSLQRTIGTWFRSMYDALRTHPNCSTVLLALWLHWVHPVCRSLRLSGTDHTNWKPCGLFSSPCLGFSMKSFNLSTKNLFMFAVCPCLLVIFVLLLPVLSHHLAYFVTTSRINPKLRLTLRAGTATVSAQEFSTREKWKEPNTLYCTIYIHNIIFYTLYIFIVWGPWSFCLQMFVGLTVCLQQLRKWQC